MLKTTIKLEKFMYVFRYLCFTFNLSQIQVFLVATPTVVGSCCLCLYIFILLPEHSL